MCGHTTCLPATQHSNIFGRAMAMDVYVMCPIWGFAKLLEPGLKCKTLVWGHIPNPQHKTRRTRVSNKSRSNI